MFSTDDFAQALESYDYSFEVGQVVSGRVAVVDRDRAFVDIGGKSMGMLPLKEASLKSIPSLAEILELDDEREFLVIRGQDADGQVTLSLRRLELKKAWNKLQEAQRAFEAALDVQQNALCHNPNNGSLMFGAATSLYNIGFLYQYRNLYDKAALVLKEALMVRDNVAKTRFAFQFSELYCSYRRQN